MRKINKSCFTVCCWKPLLPMTTTPSLFRCTLWGSGGTHRQRMTESTGLAPGGGRTPLLWGCLSSHQLCHVPVGPWSSYFPSLCPLLLLFSRLVVYNSLQPRGLQHARLPCLQYLPEFAQTHVHWVDDAIQPSHSVAPRSSCPQSFLAPESFPMCQLFTSCPL